MEDRGLLSKGEITMMKAIKNFMDKQWTWGTYFKLCGVGGIGQIHVRLADGADTGVDDAHAHLIVGDLLQALLHIARQVWCFRGAEKALPG